VVVKAQSSAASSVSLPFGSRDSEPAPAFESATPAGSASPSVSETIAGKPVMVTIGIEPS
jgi:hypothetical protein